MASVNVSPLMPRDVRLALRREFDQLPPPAARFRCAAGRDFLVSLRRACTAYGAKQVGEAIGMSTSSVYQMRYREPPRRIYGYPSEQQMRAVRRAWTQVQARRSSGMQVRPTTAEFVAMQEALVRLRERLDTDDVMIAIALGVEPNKLRVFEDKPIPRPPRRSR